MSGMLSIFFGTSFETSDLIVDCSEMWWEKNSITYPQIKELVINLVPFRGIDVGGESEPFRVSSTLPPNSITRDTITYFVDDQGHRALTKDR